MLLMGDAVPQPSGIFRFLPGWLILLLQSFVLCLKIEMLARRRELSRDGTRAPTQVRTGGRETASHVIRSFVDRPRFFVQPIGSTSVRGRVSRKVATGP